MMKSYDFQVITKNIPDKDLFSTFSKDYLDLFFWLNYILDFLQSTAYFPILQIFIKEIIISGAGFYWIYGPSLAELQVVSLHIFAEKLNYQLDPRILLKESVESIRRTEHLLTIFMDKWLEEMTASDYYHIEQMLYLLSLVRQHAEQLELIDFADTLEVGSAHEQTDQATGYTQNLSKC